MEANEKPFACFEDGCGMRFTNEDHLSVHKKKHEMSLSFSVESSQKSTPFLDETPTPTRFIRNCEEVGLFQDLQNVNPFDEQFRKAVQTDSTSVNSEAHSLSVICHVEQDTLNTPSVFPTNLTHDETSVITSTQVKEKVPGKNESSKNGTGVPSISVSEVEISKVSEKEDDDVIVLPLPVSSSKPTVVNSSKPTIAATTVVNRPVAQVINPSKNIFVENKSIVMSAMKVPISKPPAVIVSPPSVIAAPVVQPIVLHIPDGSSNISSHQIVDQETLLKNVHVNDMSKIVTVQTSLGTKNDIQILRNDDSFAKNILPHTIVLNNPITQTNITPALHDPPNVENQSANKPVNFQVLLKLPDGSSVPLQLPPVSSMISKVSASVSPVTSPIDHRSAKEKLKQVLVENKVALKHIMSPEVNNEVISFDNTGNEMTATNPGNLQSSSNSRMIRNSSEEPDEKRQKFLERNRAAATRCRLKRKSWIDSLEGKAQQLQKTNFQLQKEVSLLRKEVSYLKTMLLTHKDCPVTLQQIQQNQDSSQT